jgi:hypothetical protein
MKTKLLLISNIALIVTVILLFIIINKRGKTSPETTAFFEAQMLAVKKIDFKYNDILKHQTADAQIDSILINDFKKTHMPPPPHVILAGVGDDGVNTYILYAYKYDNMGVFCYYELWIASKDH